MTWDVEIWHDTTMWNEGFDEAREPYTVVRVPDEQAANLIRDWLKARDKALDKAADPEWGRRFEARLNPSNPNRQLGTLGTAQALGWVMGAISKWGGI